MKTCSACQQSKLLAEFFPDRRGYGDGYRDRCKPCTTATWKRTGRTPEQRRQWRIDHPSARWGYKPNAQIQAEAIERAIIRQAERAWNAMDRAIKAANRKPDRGTKAWYAIATPEQIFAYRLSEANRQRRQYRPTKAAAKVKAWKQANPGKLHAQRAARRLREDGADDGTLTNDVMAALYADAHICPYCDQSMKRKTLEHMTPLSRGGMHSITNVVIACWRCNIRKSALMPLEYIQRMLNDQ